MGNEELHCHKAQLPVKQPVSVGSSATAGPHIPYRDLTSHCSTVASYTIASLVQSTRSLLRKRIVVVVCLFVAVVLGALACTIFVFFSGSYSSSTAGVHHDSSVVMPTAMSHTTTSSHRTPLLYYQ